MTKKEILNKSGASELIRKNTMRTQIGKDAIPYLTVAFRRLLLGIIQADNNSITPNSNSTLTKKDIRKAIGTLDEKYGLRGVLKLSSEPKPVDVDLTKSGNQVDLVIRLNIERDEED